MKLLLSLAIFAAPLFTFAGQQPTCPPSYKTVVVCDYSGEESNALAPKFIDVCQDVNGNSAKEAVSVIAENNIVDGVAAKTYDGLLKVQFSTGNESYLLTVQKDGSAEAEIYSYGKAKPSAQYTCR